MPVRIALANLPMPSSRGQAVDLAIDAINEAGRGRADLICFPECFVPGYRRQGVAMEPPDAAYLERASSSISQAAAESNVGVVLGTERVTNDGALISTLVINRDGGVAGFQDKVQLDPSEEGPYVAGSGRRVFQSGDLCFGVSICHEAWRYPETVRFAARQGAHLVFVPHFHEAEPGGFRPTRFADPANTFHEKAILCRAAENTCFVAAVNYASDGSPTTSVVAKPDGTLLCYQPYGKSGLLYADIDISEATGFLASRLRALDP